MIHYLRKIIETPIIADPVKTAPDVHRHFTRYSKGVFDGPVIKVSQSKGKLSIGASYEYEDEVLRIATQVLKADEIIVSGALIGSDDFSAIIREIGLSNDWLPEKSTTQTINYNSVIKGDSISKTQLQQIVEKLTPVAYCLLSFTTDDKSVVLSTKKKPPRPSSKNPEDSSEDSKLKFCTLKCDNSPELMKSILDGIASDFKDEIPNTWKAMTISNSYEITDLILPDKDKVKDSREFRLQTLRKGNLNRVAEIDSKTFTHKIQFQA